MKKQHMDSPQRPSSLNDILYGMMHFDFLACTSSSIRHDLRRNDNNSTKTESGSERRKRQQQISSLSSAFNMIDFPPWTSRKRRDEYYPSSSESVNDDQCSSGVEIDEIVENLHLQAYRLERV
jgi:hypothetical protein